MRKDGGCGMSENKRFLIGDECCKLLNELHDENQVLKKPYADDYNEVNSMTVKISELTEENQELKQHNAELINKIDFLEQIIDGDVWMTKRFELRLCSNGIYYVYENGTW